MMDKELQSFYLLSGLCSGAVLLEMLIARGELPPWAMASAQETIAAYLRACPEALARREREARDEHARRERFYGNQHVEHR